MIFKIVATVVIIYLILLLIVRAVLQANNSDTARYYVRTLWVMIISLLVMFGLIMLVQIFNWI